MLVMAGFFHTSRKQKRKNSFQAETKQKNAHSFTHKSAHLTAIQNFNHKVSIDLALSLPLLPLAIAPCCCPYANMLPILAPPYCALRDRVAAVIFSTLLCPQLLLHVTLCDGKYFSDRLMVAIFQADSFLFPIAQFFLSSLSPVNFTCPFHFVFPFFSFSFASPNTKSLLKANNRFCTPGHLPSVSLKQSHRCRCRLRRRRRRHRLCRLSQPVSLG